MTREAWAAAWEERHLKITEVGELTVITCWFGLDNHRINGGEPLIFGSIIRSEGRAFSGEIESATEDMAMVAHEQLVAQAQADRPGAEVIERNVAEWKLSHLDSNQEPSP